MKKLNLILIVICILFLNNSVLASYSSVGGTTEIYAQSIKIIDSPKYIQVGKSIQLETSITPSNTTNKAVTWKSSDESILKVSKTGKITGIKKGTVKVTARTSNGRTYSIAITVLHSNNTTGEKKISSISIVDTPKEVLDGNKFQIKTSISPKNASNPNLTYTSSNTKIIQVDKTGYAKAVGKGTATITVKSSNGKSASIKIKVKNIKIVLDKKELKLEKGKTTTITASIKAGKKYSAKKVNWSTSATSIANATKKSSNKDENKYTATVTAKSKGTASIVIQIDDEKSTIPIKVTDNTPDYNLECPEISYDISNSKTVKMNLNFKNNIDHWDFYYSTNKSSGSKAKWEKLDTYKGNKEITQDYLNAQGKIVIYGKEGTSRSCYTAPYDVNYDYYNRNDSISFSNGYNSNITCPKMIETYDKIPGTVQFNKSYYNYPTITGVQKVYVTVKPYSDKHYQYVHFYNGENRDKYQNKWVGFNGKTTFSLNPNIKDDGTIQGEVVVLDNKGNYKSCYSNKSYSNEQFEKVEQVGTTNVYFEKGYPYNDDNMLEIINNLPSHYLASPNIYFYTRETYNKKIKNGDTSCGVAFQSDMKIYIASNNYYNNLCSEDFIKLAIVHELSHTMDFMYYKFQDNRYSPDEANYLNYYLTNYYNDYNQYWTNGQHTYLRDYAYTNKLEFWAELNSIIYMETSNDFKNNSYRNYWKYNDDLSKVRNDALKIIKNYYDNNYSNWLKYKGRGY